ncbi:MAG TPA: branched-chain amino acid ABC transporter permease [Candidatus Dormibacteraeota bacterium]|nr:branched-chain amino acid ABC transporter permease [Candidatus Dormibacteraeota bacterium]
MGSIVWSGLVDGAVFALLALGFNIIFSTTRILNFAQGEFLALGALLSYSLTVDHHLPVPAVLACVVLAMVAMGLVVERLVVLPIRLSGSSYAWIIATIAVAVTAENAMVVPFGRDPVRPPGLVAGNAFTLSGAPESWQTVLIIVAALVIVGLYEAFLAFTIYGRAFRATAHSLDITELMGIDTGLVIKASFVVSAIITGIAGVLVAPVTFADTSMGLRYTISGFVAVIVGGMGSSLGALVGGFLLGLVTAVAAVKISPGWANVIAYAALGLVLLLRPNGIVSRAAVH